MSIDSIEDAPPRTITDAAAPKRGPGRPRKLVNLGKPSPKAKAAQATGPAPAPKVSAGRPSSDRAKLQQSAESFLEWLTVPLAFASPIDAAIVSVRKERLAARLAEVAASNPQLAAFLSAAGTGGGWVGLAAELGAVGAAIAANHGAIPEGVAALVMPEYSVVKRETITMMQAERDEALNRLRARPGAAL